MHVRCMQHASGVQGLACCMLHLHMQHITLLCSPACRLSSCKACSHHRLIIQDLA